MVKVKVKQDVSNKPKFILIILGFALVMVFVIFGTGKISNIFHGSKGGSSDTSQMESILSKEEHKLTVDEWKKIADYRAQDFYECTKDLDMDITKWYLFESCATSYNNNWVFFRDGLDERANLNYDQREMLKDYWHKTRDAMTEKVGNLMKENDKKLRPNRDN